MILLESIAVADGVMDIDLMAGWTVNGDVTLAAFEVLPAEAAPQGPKNLRATTTGDGAYPPGSTCTVEAIPNTGWGFVRWTFAAPTSQCRTSRQ